MALTPLPVVPSPKFQLYAEIVPSGSLDPEPDRVTLRPAVTVWSGPALAAGMALQTMPAVTVCPALTTAAVLLLVWPVDDAVTA